MGSVLALVKGWAGKPSHPPLTDASIGAYTVGTAMLVLGALGVEEEQMAHGALLAIGGGLALALPTALTGLIDWLGIEKGTPFRRLATIHLCTMLVATTTFAVAWLLQLDGYNNDEVQGSALAVGVVAEVLLTAGGYLGGNLVFVYGVRVLKRPEVPVSDAVVPGRVSEESETAPPREEAGR